MATISEPLSNGKVVEITKYVENDLNGNKVMVLDVETLKKIFYKYENHLVAVNTIAGEWRSGKSFLQNLLLQYLQQQNVALFLMDSQGLFDNTSSESNLTTMGTLNFLISSLQYFNVKKPLDKNHFNYLSKFAKKFEKFSETTETMKNVSPFQKGSLMFVVRDWNSFSDGVEGEEYSYGLEGGEKYLKRAFREKADKAQEHIDMQKFFKDSFGDIPCFLLPEPENKEIKEEDCHVFGDLDENFRNSLLGLFKYLTNPKNIVIKKIDGKEQTCGALCKRLEVISALMHGEKSLNDVENLIAVTHVDELHSLTSKLGQKFLTEVQNIVEDLRTSNYNENEEKRSKSEIEKFLKSMRTEVEKNFNKVQSSVLEAYEKIPKDGEKESLVMWADELERLLKQITCGFSDCFIAEQAYLLAMKKIYQCAKEKKHSKERDIRLARKQRKLKKLLEKNMPSKLFQPCSKYFIEQTDLIIEQKAKSEALIAAELVQTRWKSKMELGTLMPTTFMSSLEHSFSNMEIVKNLSSAKIALSNYDQGKVEVTLCFGTVSIELESKVKLRRLSKENIAVL